MRLGADVVKSNERPINHDFVSAMIKGDVSTNAPGGHWAIKGGDANQGKLMYIGMEKSTKICQCTNKVQSF